ncbi:MAG: 3D domain-containing protein [Candidatus Eisenbacteria sp.]|nr:3D domain-containing protein [Candidatus Eisenbacteria bacterium]
MISRRTIGILVGLPLVAALLAIGVGWLVARGPLVPASSGAEALCPATDTETPPASPPVAFLPLAHGDNLEFRKIVVTGYTSSRRETDSTPFLTASMTRVRQGCLALSRDLLRTFTPGAPFDFGDYVMLPGVGVFIVEDTMNARWRNRGDIWFADRSTALHWGHRRAWIARLPEPIPEEGELFAIGMRLRSGGRLPVAP